MSEPRSELLSINTATVRKQLPLPATIEACVARGIGAVCPWRDQVHTAGLPTVAKQIKAFHDQCGVGVVDLFFQQPRVSHKEVMQEIELFGREVLPQMQEF